MRERLADKKSSFARKYSGYRPGATKVDGMASSRLTFALCSMYTSPRGKGQHKKIPRRGLYFVRGVNCGKYNDWQNMFSSIGVLDKTQHLLVWCPFENITPCLRQTGGFALILLRKSTHACGTRGIRVEKSNAPPFSAALSMKCDSTREPERATVLNDKTSGGRHARDPTEEL